MRRTVVFVAMLGLVATISSGVASARASTSNVPGSWQTVSSNGISIRVPKSWAVRPYPHYALCPEPIPAINIGLPANPVVSSCQAITYAQPSSIVSVGVPSGPYILSGKKTKLGTLRSRLYIQQRTSSLTVSAVFPTVVTQFGATFYGPGASQRLSLVRHILNTVRPSSAPAYGLLPASPGVTVRLVPSNKAVHRGGTLSVHVVVTNKSGGTIDLNNANHGCQPGIAVALVNPTWLPPTVAFAAVCTSAGTQIPVGTTRWTQTVLTSYNVCEAKSLWLDGPPSCQNPISLIPPGKYEAVLVGFGLALPPPKAVPITITR